MGNVMSGYIGSGLFGACCYTKEQTGGYLYTLAAALGDRKGLASVTTLGDTRNVSNYLGLCPVGWHLPGNLNGEWNKEWSVLNQALGGKTTSQVISKYEYYRSFDFNGYTLNYVVPNPATSSSHYNKDGIYRFSSSIGLVNGIYMAIGVGFGDDSIIVTDAVNETWPIGNQEAIPIRCIRDYTK